MAIKITISSKQVECPSATQDLELNTKNRNAAIKADHIQYGPLNLADEKYYDRAAKHWNTEPEVAKKSKCSNCIAFDVSPRMLDCLPGPVSEPIEDEEGKLGYCWMHHFKCHSARTCYTWAAGGPISDNKTSLEWQEKNTQNLKEEDEQYGVGRMRKKKQHAKELGIKLEINKTMKEENSDRDLKSKIEKALKAEGGAAGMSALEDHTGATSNDIKKAIKGMNSVGLHADGDYILDDEKQIDIDKMVKEEIDEFLLKEKDDRCTRIAKRKYDVWPSAYASGAVVKCRQGKIWKDLSEEDLAEIVYDEMGKYIEEKTDYSKEKESGLHGWFSRQGGKGKSKGWVDCNTCRTDKKTGKKTCKSCGRKEGEKRAKYPSCRPTPSACGTKGKGKKWGKKK